MKNIACTILAACATITTAARADYNFPGSSRDFGDWYLHNYDYTAPGRVNFRDGGTYTTWLDGANSPTNAVDVETLAIQAYYGETHNEFIVRNGARLDV